MIVQVIQNMTSINLSADLNSYLNRNTSSNGGLASYFSRENFDVSEKLNLGSWFGSYGSATTSESPTKLSFTLSRLHRTIGFVICLSTGCFCFATASLYIPFLILKARKFSLLFSAGSLFTLAAFSFLWGPYESMSHLCSRARLPFTFAYVSTLSLTIYFAIIQQSTILTVPCAILQIVALLWYVLSSVPGGQRGLNFLTKICWKTASKASSLPI